MLLSSISLRLLVRACTLCLVLILGATELSAQDYKPYFQLAGEGAKRYGIESGKITYQYSGASRGTEVVSFDHWGWREKRDIDKSTELWGNKTAIKQTEMLDGNYNVNLVQGTTVGRAFQDRQLNLSLKESSKAVEVLHGLEVVKRNNGVKKGRESILGKSCTIYEIPQLYQKVWIWEGIILKSEQTMLDDKITKIATRIEVDKEWEDEDFAWEEGVTINGLPNQ